MDETTATAIACALSVGTALADLDEIDTRHIAEALVDLPEPDRWATVKSPGHATAFLTVGSLEFVLDAGMTALGDLELSRRVRVRPAADPAS